MSREGSSTAPADRAEAALFAFLERDWKAQAAWLRDEGQRLGVEEIESDQGLRLSPPFIAQTDYDAVAAAATTVARALDIVVAAAIAGDAATRTRLALNPFAQAALYVEPQPSPRRIFGRFDGLFAEAGGPLQLIEYNPYPGGFAACDRRNRVFESSPAVRALRGRIAVSPVDVGAAFADSLRADAADGAPALGTVEPVHGAPVEEPELAIGANARHYGIATARADHRAAALSGESLLLAGQRVTHLLVGEWDFIGEHGIAHPIVVAVQRGWVRILNGCAAALVTAAKTVLAVLSDPETAPLFDRETQRVLAAYVPWTRSVRESRTMYRGQTIDLVPFVAAQRQTLVLKPVYGFGGRGVVIGKDVDDATWQAALQQRLYHGGIVQELVVPKARLCADWRAGELHVSRQPSDYCPYVWRDERSTGAVVRVSRNGRFNATSGAIRPPLFVVQEQT
jgi:hypothetical protein